MFFFNILFVCLFIFSKFQTFTNIHFFLPSAFDRGLLKDISPARDDNGDFVLNTKGIQREACDKTYLQVRWLYDKDEFKVIKQDARWSQDRCKPIAARERVLTDHAEWKVDYDVIYDQTSV